MTEPEEGIAQARRHIRAARSLLLACRLPRYKRVKIGLAYQKETLGLLKEALADLKELKASLSRPPGL